jgi:hypothetical protein
VKFFGFGTDFSDGFRQGCGSVPYSFFTDPDPEFDVGDQYGSGYGSGSNPIRIQGFNDPKFKKN